MTDELKEALELARPFLEEVGKAVEGGAKFSYDVLLRQQYVKVAQTGFGWLLFILFIIVPICLLKRRMVREAKKGNCGLKYCEMIEEELKGMFFLVILGVVALGALFIFTFDAIGILINPNYYVIQEVIRLLQIAK